MALSSLLAGIAVLALCVSSSRAATSAPLPRSDYVARPACVAPTPGRASCLALALRPRTAAARARVHQFVTRSAPRAGLVEASECALYASSCLTPTDLRSAYFPGEAPLAPALEPQTIALVDAYNDPSAEADLNVYASEFGLPACTKADGCFQQVNENGGEANLPFPRSRAELETFAKGTAHQREEAEEAEGWALETATDVEVAHAVCQNCRILLVEASSPEYSQLDSAENTAASRANEVSDSWGGPEGGEDDPAFNHPGVAITAAAGDDGYLNWGQYETSSQPGSPYFQGADYPAASPHVVSVGGTKLTLDAAGAWQSESVWSSEGAGGSGCSDLLAAPPWQAHVGDWAQVGCGERRANADVAAVADPSTGVNVYDSIPYPYEEAGEKLTTVLHWVPIGGTSVASPIVAAMFALAGGAHGVAYPAQTLYSHLGSPLLHDVTAGGNGKCAGEYTSCGGSLSPLSPLDCGAGAWICNATSGYDGPTGVGTPAGIGAFEPAPATTKEGEPQGKPGEEQGKTGTGETEGTGAGTGQSAGGRQETTASASGTQTAGSPAPSSGTVAGGPAGAGSAMGAVARAPRISALKLTARTREALRRRRIALAQVAFSFVLTQSAKVRAKLAVLVHGGAHPRWRTLRVSLAAAAEGINRRRLRGPGELAPGSYRLTLTPVGGVARSLRIGLR
jgi:Subtilase family